MRKQNNRISTEELRSVFDYNVTTGQLFYKNPLRITSKNKPIGTISSHGYLVMTYKKQTLYVHRVIWQIINGDIPEDKIIDHKNRNRLDNKIENLRLASQHLNALNSKLRKNNTSGFAGIYFSKSSKKWVAQITKTNRNQKYKTISLGSFINLEDAIMARKKGEELFYELMVNK